VAEKWLLRMFTPTTSYRGTRFQLKYLSLAAYLVTKFLVAGAHLKY
jgi:hypothetical protein